MKKKMMYWIGMGMCLSAGTAVSAQDFPPHDAAQISHQDSTVQDQTRSDENHSVPLLQQEWGEDIDMKVKVNTDGHVETVDIIKSSGDDNLDKKAAQSMMAALFHPFLENNVAIPFSIAMSFHVDLQNPSSPVLVVYRDGLMRYRIAPKASYPREARRFGQDGSVKLRVAVEANGHVRSVAIEDVSWHALLDAEAIRATMAAVFEPYMERGVAMPAYTHVVINFHLDHPPSRAVAPAAPVSAH